MIFIQINIQDYFNKGDNKQEGQEALNCSPEYTGQKSNI